MARDDPKLLTITEQITYNKGKPIRCECGKLIGYMRNGEIYIMCRGCKHEVNIRAESR